MARLAGIDEERSQDIAVNSQRIDDFNMTAECAPVSYLYLSAPPPDFFIKHRLAGKSTALPNTWWFYPVTTGITMSQSLLSSLNIRHERFTLVPFHFIPPVPLTDTSSGDGGRHHYRCQEAGCGNDTLMDRLIADWKQYNHMQLGMLLHTYADTYSHCGFSGFRQDENKCENRDIYNTINNKKVRFGHEYPFSPPIGHGQMGHVPDVFAFKYSYDRPKCLTGETELWFGPKEPISRNNAVSFMDCSRNIFRILCECNKRPFNEDAWNIIREKFLLIAGQIVSGDEEITDVDYLTRTWKHCFPDFTYYYKHSNCFEIAVDRVTNINNAALEKAGLTEEDMYDVSSERGIQARKYGSVFWKPVSNAFFQFNQFAYEHIYKVVGSYRPDSKEAAEL